MSPDRQRHRLPAFLVRHRAMLAMAIVLTFTTAGTAAAVSYLVLGSVNTAAATTTLQSGFNGPVLKLSATGTGTSARGLGITVPAGRAPITVSTNAGKATNLDADKLDGLDSTRFAKGTNVTIKANRIVLNSGQVGGVDLLVLPGLGTLVAFCPGDPEAGYAAINWENRTSGYIDAWSDFDSDGRLEATIAAPDSALNVAQWFAGSQAGYELALGYGYPPNPRQTATVTVNLFRSAVGAPCAFQATATLWSMP